MTAGEPWGTACRCRDTEAAPVCTLCGGPLGVRSPGGGVLSDGYVRYSVIHRVQGPEGPEDLETFTERHVVCHECMEDFPDDALYAWMGRHMKEDEEE